VHVSPPGLELGAALTFSELRHSELVQTHAPLLVDAAATIGAWQIQNRATLGGNIANASPAGDALPVLLALDATLVLASTTGERRVLYRDFHRGYRKTALAPGELIVRVLVPRAAGASVWRFRKVGTRAAQAISKASLAFAAELDGQGRFGKVRLAAGSVAPTPIRLLQSEEAAFGQHPSVELAERLATLAKSEVAPIDDVRSTADYRRFVLGQLVRRVVLEVMEQQRTATPRNDDRG